MVSSFCLVFCCIFCTTTHATYFDHAQLPSEITSAGAAAACADLLMVLEGARRNGFEIDTDNFFEEIQDAARNLSGGQTLVLQDSDQTTPMLIGLTNHCRIPVNTTTSEQWALYRDENSALLLLFEAFGNTLYASACHNLLTPIETRNLFHGTIVASLGRGLLICEYRDPGNERKLSVQSSGMHVTDNTGQYDQLQALYAVFPCEQIPHNDNIVLHFTAHNLLKITSCATNASRNCYSRGNLSDQDAALQRAIVAIDGQPTITSDTLSEHLQNETPTPCYCVVKVDMKQACLSFQRHKDLDTVLPLVDYQQQTDDLSCKITNAQSVSQLVVDLITILPRAKVRREFTQDNTIDSQVGEWMHKSLGIPEGFSTEFVDDLRALHSLPFLRNKYPQKFQTLSDTQIDWFNQRYSPSLTAYYKRAILHLLDIPTLNPRGMFPALKSRGMFLDQEELVECFASLNQDFLQPT